MLRARNSRKKLNRKGMILFVAIIFITVFLSVRYLGGSSNNIVTSKVNDKHFVLFQTDDRWKNFAYGSSDIEESGCAPTCLSMVIMLLTGDYSVTPDKVAVYAEKHGYYIEGTGTSWSLMTQGAEHFGVTGSEMCLSRTKVTAALKNGNPIICSMGPGDFTTEGHFIVLEGIKNGKIILADPNSEERSNMLWNYETLEGQIKNLWMFNKK